MKLEGTVAVSTGDVRASDSHRRGVTRTKENCSVLLVRQWQLCVSGDHLQCKQKGTLSHSNTIRCIMEIGAKDACDDIIILKSLLWTRDGIICGRRCSRDRPARFLRKRAIARQGGSKFKEHLQALFM